MGAFIFIMALTLAVTGLFLYRNYARFLKGAYSKHARVISIQQVFSSCSNLQTGIVGYVKNGFYPVIEYNSSDGPISFTSIDQNISGNFHVGDEIKLRVIKTRRSKNRVCKTVVVLVSMLTLLGLNLLISATTSDSPIPLVQVFFSSFILGSGLLILVLYMKDQDAQYDSTLTNTKGGRVQLSLAEPAAFKNWTPALRDPVQRYKIRSTKFFGAACMCSAVIMLTVAIQPIALPLVSF